MASQRTTRKGQGQWALGHLEPLTPNERVKKDDDGLNVRARVENIYAHNWIDFKDRRYCEGCELATLARKLAYEPGKH